MLEASIAGANAITNFEEIDRAKNIVKFSVNQHFLKLNFNFKR